MGFISILDKGKHTFKTTSNASALLATQSSNNLISVNNNNNDNTQDKNIKIGSGEFGRNESTNGDGVNNNVANENFANFDAFSSTGDLDLYGNIEFSITQNNMISIGSSTSTDAKDRFLGSLSFTSDNPKKFNDNFDTKFASFMTNESTCKKKADPKPQQKSQQTFSLNDEENFADFSNANVFKATDNLQTHFEATSQNTLPKSTDDCYKKKMGENKLSSKFFDDYSKNGEFDADLQEALKRSLTDQ